MPSVLIIDQSTVFRGVARRALLGLGWDVIEAKDGLAGMQRAVEDAPDRILIDADLTGLSGFHICRALRENESTRDRPIALWSSAFTPTDRARAQDCGADLFLERSIQLEDLSATAWGRLDALAHSWLQPSDRGDRLSR